MSRPLTYSWSRTPVSMTATTWLRPVAKWCASSIRRVSWPHGLLARITLPSFSDRVQSTFLVYVTLVGGAWVSGTGARLRLIGGGLPPLVLFGAAVWGWAHAGWAVMK